MNLGFLSSPNRWAYFMASLLFLLVTGYIIWHYLDKPGSKNVMLSSSEQADIQNILDDSESLNDSGNTDSTSHLATPKSNSATTQLSFEMKRRKVYDYITQTHTMLDSASNAQLWATCQLLPDEQSLRSYLSTHPVRVYSPYHLNGRSLLWELICWALFGVFCNLFYSVSEAYKGTEVKKAAPSDNPTNASSEEVELVSPNAKSSLKKRTVKERLQRRLLGGFDPAEVPSHLAKLLYTPFLVVILYLALISFNSTTDLQWVQYGEGIIVFAFIVGFFSGRMVDLLERIKDLILPIGRFGNEPPASNPAVDTTESDDSPEKMDSFQFISERTPNSLLSNLASANNLLPVSGFANLKLKYRLELDKPDRQLDIFTLGFDNFLSVVKQQLDSTKTVYSNEKLSTTLDTFSNDVAGTPDFFKVFVNLRIRRGDSIPDPAAQCFLFLSFIDPDTNKPVAFPPHTPNPRNATLVFKMPSSGIIAVHEDVLWKQPSGPQPASPQPIVPQPVAP
ncbi:hypothetical protein WBJ53_05375 [Spirosoma sp. SC4-14]|uniref:hypothetical protein n=1 Tax=Spirosoma sp. SC4-14 TaxID=3128900 RepID=UPI0030CB7D8B